MSIFRKLAGIAVLLMAAALGACNLSQSGALQEVALNPPTLEASPTRTPIPFNSPTRTAFAAPTITVLGGDDRVVQPASQVVDVAVVPTQPPPLGVCSLKATGDYDINVRQGPGKKFSIIDAIPSGQYRLVIGHADNGWLQVSMSRETAGWVSPKVVTFYGPCSNLPVNALLAPNIPIEPSLTPTPTAQFGFTVIIPLNHLITKAAVGSIPAGTTVMVTTTQFTGSEYLYGIVTSDGRSETARDYQLAFSEIAGALPFTTPTLPPVTPSATAPVTIIPTQPTTFQSELGMNVFRVRTTAAVGDIPAGTAVRVSTAMFDGTIWTYDIATKDELHATAYEWQLAYIPGAGGGGPTPANPFPPQQLQ